MPILEVKNICKSFGSTEVLKGISFSLEQGEFLVVCGKSGCGKSTLLRHFKTAMSPYGERKGQILLEGRELDTVSVREQGARIGYVLQSPDNQLVTDKVWYELAFGLENLGYETGTIRLRVAEMASFFGIQTWFEKNVEELSGGQKQLLNLAAVMAMQPDLLVLDEPTSQLDPLAAGDFLATLRKINAELGTTILIIEHRLEDVLWRDVDRIVLVNGGTILADLRPDELLSGSLLAENGIREPLYVTALRYAGVELTPDKHPAHVDSLVLDDTDTQKLRDWFTARPQPAAQPEREPLLEVKGLSFGYQKGQQTLRDVSFSIGKGEMVSIVGRNGAGKSTLSKLICGFETPDAGEIFLNGKPLAEENIRRRAQHIGYVMQNPNQMISKTMIYEEVALGLQRSGLTEEQIREKVEATLRVCGLYPFRNWPISALSFGQKKRVTIASVLVLDPELILLDEPTAGQDFRHYTDIMEFLRGLNARGVTVVMITHDMHLMLEYTRRALVFCDGRLIADRTAAAVLCDPALVEQAALKETSLYTLANRCGIAPAQEFVERFIEQDREVREGGC